MSSSRTALQLRRYARSVLVLIVLIVVGVVAGFYILLQERLPNPFTSYYTVNAAFSSAAAVVPGLGEPVTVAGVHVGQILTVDVRAGQGVVTMEIDPKQGVPHLYRNAYAVLTPQTPLDNMYIDIYPGSKSAGVLPDGGTIPVGNTMSPVNSDEFLDELDVDTRNWFTSLVTSLSTGTAGRGPDVKRLLELLGPTAEQTETVATLLADRRTEVASLVHNLGVLTSATSQDDAQLASLVTGGDQTLGALASEDAALTRSVKLLPGTLAATRQTFTDVVPFATALGPTATALVPLARHLPSTLASARTLIQTAGLLPADKVREFEQTVVPLSGTLTALSNGIATTKPLLTTTFKALQYITNELGYRPSSTNPGFLYWVAWFAHNADSFVGNGDANGPAWRSLLTLSCASLAAVPASLKTILDPLTGAAACS